MFENANPVFSSTNVSKSVSTYTYLSGFVTLDIKLLLLNGNSFRTREVKQIFPEN